MFQQCVSLFAFFVTLNVVLSAPTISEQNTEYGYVLERMTRLEVKMELMEREIQREVLADNVAEIKTILEPFSQTLEKISGNFEKVMATAFNNTGAVSSTRDVPHVAFTAYNPADRNLSRGQTIVFHDVSLNEGNGYNSATGEFRAPAEGLYLFSVHMCNTSGKYVGYVLVHDGANVAYSVQFQPYGDSCSSVNTLRKMNVGQKMLVKITYVTSIKEGPYRRNTFMGVLLR